MKISQSLAEKVLFVMGVGLIIFVLGLAVSTKTNTAFGSVAFGNDYQATTTDQTWPTLTPKVLKSTNGSLGSVVITTVGTGSLTLYDATTTDVTLRTNGTATSSLVLANFQVTTTGGTYTFDRNFYNGLIAVWIGTNNASTTITYR